MLKLVKPVVLLGLLAAVLFLVPFGGRTLFDRWRAASGPRDFAARTWAEMRGGQPPAAPGPKRPKPVRPAPAAEPESRPAPDQPLETTTEEERRSLDKLLDQHLSEKPKR
jgi:hypothetical protein